MTDVATKRIPRGKGWHNTGTAIASADYGGVQYEGTVRVFGDFELNTNALEPLRRRSPGDVVCVLVRNVSGFNLLPGRLVKWAAGYRGKRVAGYANVDYEEVAGVVDEFWPSTGVPDGELFWLVVKGHTLVKTSLAGNAQNNIAVGDILTALTAATTGATTAGRVQPRALPFSATETTDGTMTKVLTNFIGKAASAKTTAQTNNDLLVELDCHWRG